MKAWVCFAALLASGTAASAEGPFCLVTANYRVCHYQNANQCRAAAYQFGGMCVLNEQPQDRSILDLAEHVQAQGAAGRDAARQPAKGQTAPEIGWAEIADAMEAASQGKVEYICNGKRGDVPLIGCVVAGYTK